MKVATMEMFDPGHPGEIIGTKGLSPLGLTASADALGVSRKALSDVLNGHSAVSPEMAIRLEKVGWSTADHWLRMQMQRNLWEVRRVARRITVKKRLKKPVLVPM